MMKKIEIGDIVMIPEDNLFNLTVIDIIEDVETFESVALVSTKDCEEIWFMITDLEIQPGFEV